MTVRRLTAADAEQLRAARLAALAEAPYAFGSTLEREQAFTPEVWRERAGAGRTFGAFAGGQLAGLATGFPAEGGPDWHLVGMWVAPSGRGSGVAARLVAEVCELARRSGASAVSLWVTDVNERARAFYRRIGFQPTGRRQPVRPEQPEHTEEELRLQLS
jgi:ribosomal protein S18 acetylase RimI-like enzyme